MQSRTADVGKFFEIQDGGPICILNPVVKTTLEFPGIHAINVATYMDNQDAINRLVCQVQFSGHSGNFSSGGKFDSVMPIQPCDGLGKLGMCC